MNVKQVLSSALADLEGAMPELEPSGDRTHPGWTTISEIKILLFGSEHYIIKGGVLYRCWHEGKRTLEMFQSDVDWARTGGIGYIDGLVQLGYELEPKTCVTFPPIPTIE